MSRTDMISFRGELNPPRLAEVTCRQFLDDECGMNLKGNNSLKILSDLEGSVHDILVYKCTGMLHAVTHFLY